MANEFVQTMSDARVDARSLSDFVFKPAGFKVPRRLAPPIDTLQFYIDRFDATKAATDAYVSTIPTIVNDAINNTAVEGGILADTFVTVTAAGQGAVAQNQRDVNKLQKNLRGFGGKGGGLDDTTAFNAAVAAPGDFIVNTDSSVIDQALITKTVAIKGYSKPVLKQEVINKHILYVGYPTYAPEYKNTLVYDASVEGLVFDSMPLATLDDFDALKFAYAENGISKFNKFKRVENAITFGGDTGRDNTSLCDHVVGARRFTVQNFGAKYTKIIGLATHNNGVNTGEGFGGINNNGYNVGIRLASSSEGVIVSASNIRDKTNAVSHQAGGRYNILSGCYYENCSDSTVVVTSGSKGRSYGNLHNGFIARKSERNVFNLRGGSLYRIDGLIAEHNSTVFSAIDINGMNGIAAEKNYRISFDNGAGQVPDVGTIISMGATTAAVVRVEDNNYQTLAPNTTMPETGEILVNNITGGYFKKGALTGISASALNTYAADGRHRIDTTINGCNATGVIAGSDSNLISLIASNFHNLAAYVFGDYNIADVVSADNQSSIHVRVDGHHNIIRCTDKSLEEGLSAIRIYGDNNIITGNCNGIIYVYGKNNNLDVVCDHLFFQTDAKDNVSRGQCNTLTQNPHKNEVSAMRGATFKDTITDTTNALGEITIEHNMINRCKNMQVSIKSDIPYFVTSRNYVTDKKARVKIYNLDGTPLANSSITLDVHASV